MKHWALPDAKARLSELVPAAEREPQSITLRGEEAAASEYRRLQGKGKAAKRSMTLLEALRTWAGIKAQYRNAHVLNAQIAGPALIHGLTLVTRNIRTFAFAGLAVFNPWAK